MKVIFVCIALLVPISTHAGAHDGKVKHLYVNTSGLVLFALDGTQADIPACSTNTAWRFGVSLNTVGGSQMYATLLAAKTVGSVLRVGYADTCNVFATAADAQYIYSLNFE